LHVLSFDITHHLTDLLLGVEAVAEAVTADHGAPTVPILVAIWDQPSTVRGVRQLRAAPLPVPSHAWQAHPAGTAGVLSTVAAALGSPAAQAALGLARDLFDQRLLAVGLVYQTRTGQTAARCVDAVDVDGRLYRLNRPAGGVDVAITIDDDPTDADPSTRGLLTAIVRAAQPGQPTSPGDGATGR
jgi:hypothetical protein